MTKEKKKNRDKANGPMNGPKIKKKMDFNSIKSR
jgi:hypothetical protein